MKEKTYVEDVDRNMYDFRNDEKDAYRIKNGLTDKLAVGSVTNMYDIVETMTSAGKVIRP